MTINRGEENLKQFCFEDYDPGNQYVLELKDCNLEQISLTQVSICKDCILFSFNPSCDLKRGHSDYELKEGENIIQTGIALVQ